MGFGLRPGAKAPDEPPSPTGYAPPLDSTAWDWRRSGEPAGLCEHDFVEDRLSRLVRRTLEAESISLGRAAEILGVTRDEMRKQAREWVT